MSHHPILISRTERFLIHLFQTSYEFIFVTFLTVPGRYRCPPISFSRKVPVFHLLEPLAKTTLFKMSRHPVYGFIRLDQFEPELTHRHKPRLPSIVKKGSITPPTVRIFMLVNLCF